MSLVALVAKVLLVGHSLVGPDLAPLVEAGLRAMGHTDAVVEAQIINGAPLRWNWEHSAEAEGLDGKARLASGVVDALVLTEALPLANHVEWSDSAGQVAQWAGLAWKADPQTQVFVYETWHDLRSAPGAEIDDDAGAGVAWADRIAADLPVWESLAAQADAARPEGAAPIRLIPAGQAMAQAAKAAAAGDLPDVPDIRALFHDDIHPNGKGLYLVAMVHLAALTGENPEGLPARLTRRWQNRDGVVSDALALALQRIAWQAVAAQRAREAARPVPAASAAPPAGPEAEAAQTPAPPPETVASVAPGAPPVFATLRPHDKITNPNLALGLSSVVDWSVAQPFLDVMKTARPWVGHLPGQWGGMEHDALASGGWLDDDGWLKALPPDLTGVSTLFLTDLPEGSGGVAGRYVVRWQGEGTLGLDGRAKNVTPIDGGLTFDYTPGEGAVVLTISQIDPQDPLRRIEVIRQDRLAAHDAGALFNPDWLSRIRGARMLRFMDWMAVNGSALVRIEDSPKLDDYTWARNGVPVEVMVALANELDADAWFNMPHLADDALVRFTAETVADLLEPGLKAYVEYSNEMWNWQFEQAHWAEAQGKARWGEDSTWVQYYALRAAEVAGLWAEAFGPEGKDRLVRVITTQTGWLGLEEQILDAPLVVKEGRPAPKTAFDAYAVTGYFAGLLGNEAKLPMIQGWLIEGAEADPANPWDYALRLAGEELADGRHSGIAEDTLQDLLTRVLPYQADVARKAGLRLVMYEGGSHVVGYGPVVDDAQATEFYTRFNASPEMGALYDQLLQGWARLSDAPFNSFGDIAAPSKWGSWGALRHLDDDTPRWAVLAKGCGGC